MIPEKNGTYNACSTVESCHKGENCSWKRRNGSRLQGVKQTGVRARARPLLFLTCQEGVLRIKIDGVKHHFSTQNWIMEFQRMKIKWHHDFDESSVWGAGARVLADGGLQGSPPRAANIPLGSVPGRAQAGSGEEAAEKSGYRLITAPIPCPTTGRGVEESRDKEWSWV